MTDRPMSDRGDGQTATPYYWAYGPADAPLLLCLNVPRATIGKGFTAENPTDPPRIDPHA